jgi:hypothetical protein
MTDSAPKLPETARTQIADRWVTVKRPNETQITIMHRGGTITSQALAKAIDLAEKAEEIQDPKEREAAEEAASPHFAAGLTATAEILDVMEYLLVDEADRVWVHDQMKRGNVQLTDLFDAFEQFKPKRKKATGAPKAAKRIA